jgi:hypothetical protein
MFEQLMKEFEVLLPQEFREIVLREAMALLFQEVVKKVMIEEYPSLKVLR